MVSANLGTMVSGDSFIYCRFKLPILSGFNIKMQISSVLVFFLKERQLAFFFLEERQLAFWVIHVLHSFKISEDYEVFLKLLLPRKCIPNLEDTFNKNLQLCTILNLEKMLAVHILYDVQCSTAYQLLFTIVIILW